MPWESIGDCGDGQLPHEREWIVFCLEMGIAYLRHICGAPSSGCEIGIMWHEHELSDYPSIGLLWEYPEQTDALWKYINQCETALAIFDDAIAWSEINPAVIQEAFAPDITDEDEDGEIY